MIDADEVREFIRAQLKAEAQAVEILETASWDPNSVVRQAIIAAHRARITMTTQVIEAARELAEWAGDDVEDEQVYSTVGVVLARQWASDPGFKPEWAAGYVEPEPEPGPPPTPPLRERLADVDRFTWTNADLNAAEQRGDA